MTDRPVEAKKEIPRVANPGEGQVMFRGALSMQVCVPAEWTDDQVKEFADRENLCGTENGWFIRRDGDKALAGARERVTCASDPSRVHIMFDA
jgi:hypothetical protein